MPTRLLLILLLAGPLGAAGCLDFSGEMRRRNDALAQDKERLESRVRAARSLFDERDRAMQERNMLESRLEQIRTLSRQEGGGSR